MPPETPKDALEAAIEESAKKTRAAKKASPVENNLPSEDGGGEAADPLGSYDLLTTPSSEESLFGALTIGSSTGVVGSTSSVGTTPSTTAVKDILITPSTSGSASAANDIVSQLDFKWTKAGTTPLIEPNATDLKVTLYPWAERFLSASSPDTPILIMGGSWQTGAGPTSSTVAPTSTYGNTNGIGAVTAASATNSIAFHPNWSWIDVAYVNGINVASTAAAGTGIQLTALNLSSSTDTNGVNTAVLGRKVLFNSGDITIQGDTANSIAGGSVLSLPSASATFTSSYTGGSALPVTSLINGVATSGTATSVALTIGSASGTLTLGGNVLAITGTGNVTVAQTSGQFVFSAGTTTTRNLTFNGGDLTLVGNGSTLTMGTGAITLTGNGNVLNIGGNLTTNAALTVNLTAGAAGHFLILSGSNTAINQAPSVTSGSTGGAIGSWGTTGNLTLNTVNSSGVSSANNLNLAQYDASGFLYSVTPTTGASGTTVVTKAYVDAFAQGLDSHASCRAKTYGVDTATTHWPTNFSTYGLTFVTSQATTYGTTAPGSGVYQTYNGVYPVAYTANGVLKTNLTVTAGAAVTGGTSGATVDGVALNFGDRIVINDFDNVTNTGGTILSGLSASANLRAANGIYTVGVWNNAGTYTVIFVRTYDSNDTTGGIIEGAYVFIEEGTQSKASGWIETNTISGAINTNTTGTNSPYYTQFGGASQYTAGLGIVFNGTQINTNVNNTNSTNSISFIGGAPNNGGASYIAGSSVTLTTTLNTTTGITATAFTLTNNASTVGGWNLVNTTTGAGNGQTLTVTGTSAGTATIANNASQLQLSGGTTNLQTLNLTGSSVAGITTVTVAASQFTVAAGTTNLQSLVVSGSAAVTTTLASTASQLAISGGATNLQTLNLVGSAVAGTTTVTVGASQFQVAAGTTNAQTLTVVGTAATTTTLSNAANQLTLSGGSTNTQSLVLAQTGGVAGTSTITVAASQFTFAAGTTNTQSFVVSGSAAVTTTLASTANQLAISGGATNLQTLNLTSSGAMTTTFTMSTSGSTYTFPTMQSNAGTVVVTTPNTQQIITGGSGNIVSTRFQGSSNGAFPNVVEFWPSTSGANTIGAGVWISQPSSSTVKLNGDGTGLGGFTTGRLLFGQGATSAIGTDGGLYWDNTNKRLGIGAGTTPDSYLHVQKDSAGTFTQGVGIRVSNEAAATNTFGGAQDSPAIGWSGSSYDTGATAARYARWRSYVKGVSGSPAAGHLVFASDIDSANTPPYRDHIPRISFTSTGLMRVLLETPRVSSSSTLTTGGTLAISTTYFYAITVTDAAGNESAYLEASQATGGSTSTNTITLNWTAISGANNVKVYRATSSNGYSASSLIATLAGNVATYTDTGSAAGAGQPPTVPNAFLMQMGANGDFAYQGSSQTMIPYGTSAGNTQELRFRELLANGSRYTGFKAADTMSPMGTLIYTLPNTAPSSGQVLTAGTPSGGYATLSWTSATAGTVTGTGTAYNMPVWSSTSGLGASLASQDNVAASATNWRLTSDGANATASPMLEVLNAAATRGQTTIKVTGTTGTTNALTVNNAANSGSPTAGTLILDLQKNGTSKASIDVDGNIKGTTKSFDIPHPTKDGYRLVYGSLEGPEHGAYHRGTAQGSGIVRVDFPVYWYKLIGDNYSVSLTAYGDYTLYIVSKDAHGFTVRCGGIMSSRKHIKFDFFAVGSRIEAPLVVEQPCPALIN